VLTNKQTNTQTDAAENMQCSSLRCDVWWKFRFQCKIFCDCCSQK